MPKTKLLLLAACILGLVLRTIWIDRLPIGFTPDEAALGYNAYSLLRTGRDEWGTPFWQLPFTNLKSFGDYKLPLYSFLTVPTVKLFGLNEFSTRLPNAVFGNLSIISVFLLTRRLFDRSAAIAAATLMAVSPWSIQMSRLALEANLVTFFLPLAVYAWISRRWFSAIVLLALNFYSYHSARLLTLLMIPLLFALYRPQKIVILKSSILILILLLPGLYSLAGSGSVRGTDVAIISPTDSWSAVADRRFAARISGLPDGVARIFSNKLVYTVSVFTKNYLSYLSPQFLFTSGAGESTYGMIPGRGLLYYIELPLLLAFVILLFRSPGRQNILLLALVLITVLPAALAKGQGYSANRVAAMLPFLAVMAAAGLVYLFNRTLPFKQLLKLGVVIGYCLLVTFFVEDYIYHSPRVLARGMNHGLSETINRTLNLANDLRKNIYFSRSLSEPHIYLAFYSQLDPDFYQWEINQYQGFQSEGYKFLDQYPEISILNWHFGSVSGDKPGLHVGRPDDFPADFPEHFHIDYPDGSTAVKVIENP